MLGLTLGAAMPPQPRPNVVVFVVDDMGWQDASVPFADHVTPLNRRYHTPNMERLARQGVLFTDACASPVCSPSRVSLMTGASPLRHGVVNWTLYKDRDTSDAYPGLKGPVWNMNGLQPSPLERAYHAPTLAQALQKLGYRTIHIGKAHFGAVGTPGEDPKNLGFDVNVGGHAAGGPGSYLPDKHFSAKWRGGDDVWDIPHLEAYWDTDTFLTEALTLEANKAMDRAVEDGKPFFLYLSHYAVHVPLEKDARYYQKYIDAGLDATEATYAALVEGMDDSLGRVMDRLEHHGIEDNTIIWFTSDNGGLAAHGRTPPLNVQNAPLRSGKGAAYEGGTRVPMLVKWPGTGQSGVRSSTPICIEDLFPSLMAMVGGDSKPYRNQWDGRSIVPLLTGKGRFDAERPIGFHYPVYWGIQGDGVQPFSAVRKGDWKMIHFYKDSRQELYNLRWDLSEKEDLSKKMPVKAKALAGELAKLLKKHRSPMPLLASGEVCAYPQ